jgi:hypothetical protein
MPVTATRSLTVSVTAVSTAVGTSSSWIPLDIFETPFNVGFGLVHSGAGGMTFRVEHTFDDVFDTDVTPVAFTHEDVSAATTNIDGNYAFGIRAMRVTVVSACGSSSVSLRVVQVGNSG